MNEKEQLILQLIKEDPFITQIDLAEKTGLSRSAVAGYISSLTKGGKLLGRAYVLPDKKEILCIGGANIDRKIQVLNNLQYGTSNPAESSQSCGGVARNIAENLGRLGVDVSLMTIVGEDNGGEWLLDYTKSFVDISPSQISPTMATGTYTAVLNTNGELAIALADMSIYDTIDRSFIEKKWGYAASAGMIVMDTNFPAKVLEQVILRCHEEKIPLCITPVSSPKIKKLPKSLHGVTWLIANQDEASALSGIEINGEEDFFRAAELIKKKGVEKVVITRGDKGLIYVTNEDSGSLHPPSVHVVDVTGAGDSLVAGIMFANRLGLNTVDACKMGVACSSLTLQSQSTVNPNIEYSKLQEIIQQFY